MNVLIDNGTYALENMGDVAMLQACVARLRRLWPHATLGVLTRRPDRLARYCPDATPVNSLARDQFITPGSVLGKLHRVMPGIESMLRSLAPQACGRVALARIRRRKLAESEVPEFARLLRSADAVVTSGGGYITDEFPWLAERILRTILLAQTMGKRTAMLGQGLGPIEKPKLRSLASRALPRLDLLTLREGPANLALLQSLGVPTARAIVTGDDAIEEARSSAAASLGTGIGVNLRTTRYSGAGDDTIAALRPILHEASASRGAELVPVPISYNDAGEDVRVLRALLDRDVPSDDSVQTPGHCHAAVAACRVVATGAYHAAVFALSSGVPAVALAGSTYYVNKFEGLRSQFDGRLEIVRLDHAGWQDDLRKKLNGAWRDADTTRPALLAAADCQVRLACDACAQMGAWFERPASVPTQSANENSSPTPASERACLTNLRFGPASR